MKANKVSIFSNVCPKCHVGKVFNFFLFIERKCTDCGLVYEKEEGYFFGPMIISYFVTLLLALPVLLYCMFKTEVGLPFTILATGALISVIGPVLYRYSKLIWLHIETKFDQQMQAEQARAVRLQDKKNKK